MHLLTHVGILLKKMWDAHFSNVQYMWNACVKKNNKLNTLNNSMRSKVQIKLKKLLNENNS